MYPLERKIPESGSPKSTNSRCTTTPFSNAGSGMWISSAHPDSYHMVIDELFTVGSFLLLLNRI